MELIDWRELYAANRSVIEGNRGAGNLRGTARLPKSGDELPTPPALPEGGGGTWERFTYTGRVGRRPYFVYTPQGLGPRAGAPLLVMLHGFTQTAAGLGGGARMDDAG